MPETQGRNTAPTYSVKFPSAGNFKFVCLVHADMTGVVHVLSPSGSFLTTRTSMTARRGACKPGCLPTPLA